MPENIVNSIKMLESQNNLFIETIKELLDICNNNPVTIDTSVIVNLLQDVIEKKENIYKKFK